MSLPSFLPSFCLFHSLIQFLMYFSSNIFCSPFTAKLLKDCSRRPGGPGEGGGAPLSWTLTSYVSTWILEKYFFTCKTRFFPSGLRSGWERMEKRATAILSGLRQFCSCFSASGISTRPVTPRQRGSLGCAPFKMRHSPPACLCSLSLFPYSHSLFVWAFVLTTPLKLLFFRSPTDFHIAISNGWLSNSFYWKLLFHS